MDGVTREDLLRYNLIERAPLPVLVAMGSNLQVGYANRAGLSLLNRDFESVAGNPLGQVIPAVFSTVEIESITKKCLIHGDSFTIKGKQIELLQYPETPVRWLDVDCVPLLDDGQKITGVICYLKDVTPERILLTSLDSRPEYLVNFFKVAPIGIVFYRGVSFIVDAANDQALTMWGKSLKEVKGKPLEEIFPQVASDPTIRQRHLESLEKMRRGERHIVSDVELVFYRDGIPHHGWYSYIHEPYTDSSGRVVGMIAIAIEVTDQVITRTKLEEQVGARTTELSRLNRVLAEAQKVAKLGSWEWDVFNGQVTWSDEMFDIYGYRDRFPVDFTRATERMTAEDAELSRKRTETFVRNAHDDFKETGSRVFDIPALEFKITLPGGDEKILRNSGKIYLTSEGKLEKIFGAVQDVTEIRSTELQLKAAMEKLEEKNSDLQAFSYVASHDLKEPLRKILTFTDRLKQRDVSNTVDYLSKINSSALRMMDLIESILTVSHVSNSAIELIDVDLNSVFENCKSDLEVRIRETGAIVIARHLDKVKANRVQMGQLFSNLIGNSLKFCDKTPHVEIDLTQISPIEAVKKSFLRAQQYWRLTFSDNGIGFDEKYKGQVFEPFKRLHAKETYGGTGIGLSIVKKIVERHRGSIEVESQPGNGTTFIIYLPVSL
ncbi:MAG TPA: ATP-binding protein [Cyclobacteriaceae bacterium]|nr:ATP-binding protein [Cyclobacteriaceae bacterium]